MSSFLKYFWIDLGDEKKDIYVELSAEEGKQGQKGGKFTITRACETPSVLQAAMKLPRAPNDGIVRTSYSSLEEAETAFTNMYNAITNKSDIVIG